MKKQKQPPKLGMTLLFALVVFCALLITVLVSGLVAVLLVRIGLVPSGNMAYAWRMILSVAAISVPVGAVMAMAASKVPFKPVRELISSMDKLAIHISGESRAGVIICWERAITSAKKANSPLCARLAASKVLLRQLC